MSGLFLRDPLLSYRSASVSFVVAVRLLLLAQAASCGRSLETEPAAPQPGVQQPYSLAEFQLHDFDELSSLGGKWLTLRYEALPGATPPRETIVERIRSALAGNGWTETDAPSVKYVLSSMFETAPDDLHFTHGSFPGEQPHVFHNQHVYTSSDGRIVVTYFETGW